MFGPEYARACGIAALEPLGIFLPGDKNYPGESVRAGVASSGDQQILRAAALSGRLGIRMRPDALPSCLRSAPCTPLQAAGCLTPSICRLTLSAMSACGWAQFAPSCSTTLVLNSTVQ